MGRRTKPTHLKIVENARDRRPARLRSGEPQSTDYELIKPEWLTEEQQKVWDHALTTAPYGLLKSMDSDLFVSWVVAVDLRNQAAQGLINSPLLIRSANGNVMLSPYQRMFNQQTTNLKALAAEFGFSPAARTGISIEEEEEPDPTDRFFY